MINKYFYTLIILFTCLFSNSQNIKIEYKNTLNIKDNRIFYLDINKKIAHFYSNEEIPRINYLNENYYDLNNWQSYLIFPEQKNINILKPYLVSRLSVDNWIITTNVKNILGYSCTEANTEIFDPVIGKKIKIKVWFTDKIKCKIGPNGLINAPGLVLEIESNYYKLLANKINTKAKTNNINFPDYEKVTPNVIDEIIGLNLKNL